MISMKKKPEQKRRHIWKSGSVFLLSLFLLIAPGCTARRTDNMNNTGTKDRIRIMVTSDLHYLSEQLYDPASPVFKLLLSKNDGKLVEEGKTILYALKERALIEKPDALLLCGDITFNGEMISLREIRSVLEEVEAAGIPVLVTTGNHDIYYSSAVTYFGDQPERTEDISDVEFAEVMAPFGYEEALYRDEKTLSYIYALQEDLWFLVLDANALTSRGSIPSSTLLWMEEVLNRADEAGAQAIVMSHQNILIQSPMMYLGYVIDNHEAVEHILQNHQVYLSVSGHSHLQHTARSGGLYDICNESLSVYPLQYGLIDVNLAEREFIHELIPLGVLEQESFDRFAETVLRMVIPTVENTDADSVAQAQMSEYAIAVNAAYFSGNRAKMNSLKDENGRKLWHQYAPDSFWAAYIENIFSELE